MHHIDYKRIFLFRYAFIFFSPLIFAIALIFGGLHATLHTNRIAFFLGALGLIIMWLLFMPIRKFKLLFLPALIIRKEGVIIPNAILLKWEYIRDILIFDYSGYKHMAIRLKEDVISQQGELYKSIEQDFNWLVYGMPYVAMLNSIDASVSEIIHIFHNEYGVPVKERSTPVEIGKEADLKNGTME